MDLPRPSTPRWRKSPLNRRLCGPPGAARRWRPWLQQNSLFDVVAIWVVHRDDHEAPRAPSVSGGAEHPLDHAEQIVQGEVRHRVELQVPQPFDHVGVLAHHLVGQGRHPLAPLRILGAAQEGQACPSSMERCSRAPCAGSRSMSPSLTRLMHVKPSRSRSSTAPLPSRRTPSRSGPEHRGHGRRGSSKRASGAPRHGGRPA